MSAVETLTDEERRTCWAGCEKALRIIDAHAAERAALIDSVRQVSQENAALVAQLEAEQQHSRDTAGAYAEKSEALILAEAKVAELTRERDEARAAAERDTNQALDEVDMLKRTGLQRAEAAEARVRELEAENKRIGDACQSNYERIQALETLLAASEARAAQWQADAESYRADATVAQDRLAALKDELKTARALVRDWSNFDFDCPDEYNPETDREEEDGWALERLYERTGAYLRG